MKTARALRSLLVGCAATVSVALSASSAAAQWSGTYEQFYLPAGHNWAFRDNYAGADRLFNGFDYGHAILYETLYNTPDAPASLLEETIFDRLTRRILVNPPRLPLEEAAIEVEYAKLAPEAKAMFDWAHILHRQVYDVWADEGIPLPEKDARVEELIRYYRSRSDLAFSSKPKNMELMEGQYYSTAFRRNYPKFNGLIWAYHWLQVGLYEPLVVASTAGERVAGVSATVSRFWQMIENAPDRMPRLMPMTAAVAPTFAARYPEAAIIFDNLHSMHDVVSDILASSEVPREAKRAEILRAAERYRDDSSFVMTEREWTDMAVAMGVENMGGPSVGVLVPLPQATAERGAVLGDHAMHAQTPGADAAPGAGAQSPEGTLDTATLNLLMRLLGDPVALERIAADASLRGLVVTLIDALPEEHREHLRMMLGAGDGGIR